jgi:hypothetical protein
MFTKLREPFGKAGLTVAILALVLAMVGGAYAAGGLTKSQEKQVTKIAKKYAGKPGANGTNGTNGAPGAAGKNGENGAPGTPGTSGANGKTVLHGTGAPAVGLGTEGDFYIDTATDKIYGPKTAVWGAGTELKGKAGNPWTLGGTLPASTEPGCPCTETGTWAFGAVPSPAAFVSVPISFPIPLADELSETQVHFLAKGAAPTTECPGTAAAPQAEPGNLCVYTRQLSEELEGELQVFLRPGGGGEGAGTAGSVLVFGNPKQEANGFGTWAVTAE